MSCSHIFFLACESKVIVLMYTLSTIIYSDISSAALASCVAVFGGLVPNNVRSTIDSILHSCLTTLYCSGGSSIFVYAEAKRSMLQLATNCVTVPWGDGGRSTINEIVRKVSLLLKNDTDVTVASMALSTLCVVDAFTTPRAPAILIASRNQDSTNDLTATEMLRSINEKEMEVKTSSRAKETKEKKSTKKDQKTSAKPAAAKSKKTDTDESSAVKTKKSKITETTKSVKKELESSNGVDAIKNVTVESDNKKISSTITKTVASNDDVAADVMDVDEITKYADKAEAMSQQERSDDDFSLEDFPEIVDEEPDEGDRM